MQRTAHKDLVHFRPAYAVVAIFLQFKGLVNKITGKYNEKYQQRWSSLKLTDTARSN